MRSSSASGQASAEYVGLIALLALALGALGVVVPAALGRDLAAGVCSAAGFCSAPVAGTIERPSPRESFEAALELPLDAFTRLRDSPFRDPRLDWSSDGCSAPLLGDSGPGYDFSRPCLRHDFGYRNAEAFGRFDELRASIDERFLEDMHGECARRIGWSLILCHRWAARYHRAVDLLGGIGRGGPGP